MFCIIKSNLTERFELMQIIDRFRVIWVDQMPDLIICFAVWLFISRILMTSLKRTILVKSIIMNASLFVFRDD